MKEINDRLKYFGLESFFVLLRASPGNDPSGKGKIILEVLEKMNLKREDALMIGDSYNYDYLGVKNVGVDAFWIENPVSKLPNIMPIEIQKISEVNDILELLE